ncbi:hypothetical protein Erwinia_phage_Pastis_00098 [Erwinia phage Pastis]|nr:hypothetical protein Erwinia_phage_Pastis_00098 [Erwinia phage Pastis]
MGYQRKYSISNNVAYIVHGYVLTFMDENIKVVPGQEALDRYVELCRESDDEVSTILCGEEICLVL